MSTEHQHMIKSKVFEISFNLASESMDFQKRLSMLIRNDLSEITERCLSHFDSETTRYIHKLELDLKDISYDRFEQLLPRMYEEKLMSALSAKLGAQTQVQAEEMAQAAAGEKGLSMIRYFLIKGYMPWNFGNSGWNNFDELFRDTFEKYQAELLNELNLLLKSDQARTRLVNHLEEKNIIALVRKVEPAQADVIIRYHKDWMGIQKKRSVFKSNENELTKRFWQFILDYLYEERGSYFNTKSFLLSTLRKVAAHFNVAFEFAVGLLKESYQQLTEIAERSTFNRMIGDILKDYDLSEAPESQAVMEVPKSDEILALEEILHYARYGQWRVQPPNDADYERALSYHITYDGKGIIRLLKMISDQQQHVYRLIQPITDGGVHRLVQVLQPSEHKVILNYHKEVVKGQRNEPQLAGTTHEFSRVLWSIILIILADNHGSAFNHKIFVRSLIQRTSQHFNISYRSLIERLRETISLMEKTAENQRLFKLIASIFEQDFGNKTEEKEARLTMAEYQATWIVSSITEGRLHFEIQAQGYHQLKDFLKLYSAQQPEQYYQIVKAGFGSDRFVKAILTHTDQQIFANLAQVSTQKHGISWDQTFRLIDGLPSLEVLNPLSQQEAIREFALRWVLGLIVPGKNSLERKIMELVHKYGIEFNAFMKSLHWMATESQNETLIKALKEVMDHHHIKLAKRPQTLTELAKEKKEISVSQVDALVSILLSGIHGIFDRKSAVKLGFRSVEEVLDYLIKHQKERLLKALGSLQLESEPFIGIGREISYQAFYKLIVAINASKGEGLVRLLKNLEKEVATGTQSTNRFLSAARTLVLVHLGRRRFNQDRFLEEFVTLILSTAPAVYMRVVPLFIQAVKGLSLPGTGNVKDAIDELEDLVYQSTQAVQARVHVDKAELKNTISEQYFSDTNTETVVSAEQPARESTSIPYFDQHSANIMDEVFIQNAGLVLINPYIPMLFDRCGLVSNGKFISTKHQQQAVLLLQHVIFDDQRFDENLLPFNKLLCGWELTKPIEVEFEISESRQTMIHGMIEAIINHWTAIGSTSLDGFRGTWLWRKGKLEQLEENWDLTVEKASYDILLDQLPYGITPIKYNWMEKPLSVNWR